MSIIVHQRPDNYTPVYNELPFVVSSTEESQSLFKYIVRLYNSLSFLPANLLKEYALEPWPDGGMVFDPGSVLKDYVSYDVSDVAARSTGFQLAINSNVDYQIVFIEQYGADQALYASGYATGNTAVNAALNYKQWVNLDIADYFVNIGSQAKFLTNSPRNVRIRDTESYCLGYMTDDPGTGIFKSDYRLVITTYNEAGAGIATYTLNNTFSLIDDERYINIFCGPYDLNRLILTTGSQPVITDSVAKYTIKLEDEDGPNDTTETFTFTIDRNCTIYNKYRIYWLNRWGRFDAFTFKGYSRQNTKSERSDSDFSRRPQGVKSGNTYTYSPQRHSVYPFYTQYQDGIRLESDIITADELAWLEELMTSPAVFWQELVDDPPASPADYFWAVNVKGPATIDKKYRGAFNIGFDIEMAFKNHTQTR